jgi:hypothetical protein
MNVRCLPGRGALFTALPLALALVLAEAPMALAAPAPATAPALVVKPVPNASPKTILFVGNSYLYYGDSLHNHVRRMAVAAEPKAARKFKYKSVTISGSAIYRHNIKSYLAPRALGVKKPFDFVVLQGGSGAIRSAKRRTRFTDTVIAFDREIRKAGARTALYMTHAYVKPHKRFDPNMTRELEALYIATGNRVGALVIPVGLAFEEAYRQRPGLKLHKVFDGSHPDLIGTYLAACVTYATLYGHASLGNPYDYYGKIDKKMARFLQRVADRTVRKFFAR